MALDERKLRILQAIIDDYIGSAEPVGSRSIAKGGSIGLSSATIRNEMADLEEMGYLAQPHTSSGRVPSDKGYRVYVDRLMTPVELSDEEMGEIADTLRHGFGEMGRMLRRITGVIARRTGYASMSVTPGADENILKAVQVVPLEKGKALVIVVDNAGTVNSEIVTIPGQATPDFLIKASNVFNAKLSHVPFGRINLPLILELEAEVGSEKEVVLPILRGVASCIAKAGSAELHMEGAANLLAYPEFNDIGKAREILSLMDDKALLSGLLSKLLKEGYINITIGGESEMSRMRDCSVVTAAFAVGDVIVGSVGVMGPTRMDYPKVISMLRNVKERLGDELGGGGAAGEGGPAGRGKAADEA
ncbi:MAG: heat-inducible transcriptional repressor HrcA [Oscillospiraceae bacterium]|nr:heat-inducible transcriptional repressor HrcA [Oscillospiraceae bacterium]